MKVGVVQSEAGATAATNRTRLADQLTRAFEDGAHIVVAPELAAQQYFPPTREAAVRWAEPLDGPLVTEWEGLARRYGGYIVAGLLEEGDGGALYNTAVLVGPRGTIVAYRKVHLFAWEREWLTPGDRLTLVTLPDGVRVGLLICYDLRFAGAVESLVAHGMDLLAVPTTWTSIGKSMWWDAAGYCPQSHLAVGHAYANRIAVACADRVGEEASVTFLGSSIMAAPDGAVVAGPLSGRQPAVVVADLPVEDARDKRVGTQNDVGTDRRPPVYRKVYVIAG